MTIANPVTHANAEPDVEREKVLHVAPIDPAAGVNAEEGPVQGELARSVENLRNAASAIGPVNFLTQTAPAEEISALDAACEILLRLANAKSG